MIAFRHSVRKVKRMINSSEQKNIDTGFEFDDFDVLDDSEFFENYEKNTKNNKRSKDARRRIELLQEEKALKESLDEYYYHLDD